MTDPKDIKWPEPEPCHQSVGLSRVHVALDIAIWIGIAVIMLIVACQLWA